MVNHQLVKLLSDETKLEIVRILLTGKKNVTQLAKHVKKSQPNTSIALRNLLLAKIIKQEKQGRETYYALEKPDKIRTLIEALEALDK